MPCIQLVYFLSKQTLLISKFVQLPNIYICTMYTWFQTHNILSIPLQWYVDNDTPRIDRHSLKLILLDGKRIILFTKRQTSSVYKFGGQSMGQTGWIKYPRLNNSAQCSLSFQNQHFWSNAGSGAWQLRPNLGTGACRTSVCLPAQATK